MEENDVPRRSRPDAQGSGDGSGGTSKSTGDFVVVVAVVDVEWMMEMCPQVG